MNKTIITVVGKDTVGIIGKVCTYLADSQIGLYLSGRQPDQYSGHFPDHRTGVF